MRVCPKCGHKDPICWRPNGWHPEISYTYIDGMELLEPEIYAAIKNFKTGELFMIGEYVYWKVRSRGQPQIKRVHSSDFKNVGKRGSPMENRSIWKQVKII